MIVIQKYRPVHEKQASSTWWLWRSAQNPIPFRTRPLNTSAPMVLCLKARESRSPPSLESLQNPSQQTTKAPPKSGAFCVQNTSARGGGVTVPAQRWHYCDRRSGTSSASMTRPPADYSLHRFGRVPADNGSCRTDLVNEETMALPSGSLL